MEFAEVLKPETIAVHVKAENKAETLEYMAKVLEEAGIVNDREQFIKDVYIREEVGETGIGNYIAIPHGKSKAVVAPGVAVAILEREIEWESLDGTGAKVVILFAVGDDSEAAQEHLRLLAMFSKRLGDDRVVKDLIAAGTVEDVINVFTGEKEGHESEGDTEPELGGISIIQ